MLALLVLIACKSGGPQVPDGEMPPMALAPEQRLMSGEEAVVALFEVAIDGVAMHGEAVPIPLRSNAQGELFDLDITAFSNTKSLRITGLSGDANGDLVVDFTHAHPFPAPVNLTQPQNGFSNRADLGYTGRLLLLVDDNIQTFFGSQVRLDPTVVVGSDGYVKAAGLLSLTGFAADTFPFVLLADELEDNRIGITNGGSYMGNYDRDGRGWDQSNIVGPGGQNNGWTGFDYVHQGQEIRNTFTLSKSTMNANGGSYSFTAAVVIQYCDPRGGSNSSTKKSNRLPRAGGTSFDFAYRLPHAALDIAKISEPAPIIVPTLVDQCGSGSVDVRDWDRLATGTVANGADVDTSSDVGVIAIAGNLSETTLPLVELSVPNGLFTNTQFTKVGGAEQKLGQEAIFTGDRYGLPGSELQYQLIAGYAAGSTLIPGSYFGLIKLTDNEQQGDQDAGYHFGLTPTASPVPGPAALSSTYQIMKIRIETPDPDNGGPPDIYASPCDDGGETYGTDVWSVGIRNDTGVPADYFWDAGAGATIVSGGGSPNQISPTVQYGATPGVYLGKVTVTNPQGIAEREFVYQVDPTDATYNPTSGGSLSVQIDPNRAWVTPQVPGYLRLAILSYLASEPDRTVEIRINWNEDGDFSDLGEGWQALRTTPPIFIECPIVLTNATNLPETHVVGYEYRDDGVSPSGTPSSFTYKLSPGNSGSGYGLNLPMLAGGSANVNPPTYQQFSQSLAIDFSGDIVVAGTFVGVLDLGRFRLVCPAGSAGVFVAKFSPDGTPLWARRFFTSGITPTMAINEVDVDSFGDIFISGGFKGITTFNEGTTFHTHPSSENLFALKLGSSQGQTLWADGYVPTAASGTVQLLDAAADPPVGGQDLHLAGSFTGQVNFGGGLRTPAGGTEDGYIVQISTATGAYMNDRVMGDNAVTGPNGDQAVHALNFDLGGAMTFAGTFNNEVDWCNAGSPCGGSPYSVVGFPARIHTFIGRIDGANLPILGRLYTVTGTSAPSAVFIDSGAGGLNGAGPEHWIAGSFDAATMPGIGAGVAGEQTPFLIAVTPTFVNVTQRTFPGAVANTFSSAFMDLKTSEIANRIYVSGRFDSPTNFGAGIRALTGTPGDGFVVAFDRTTGAHVWERFQFVAGSDTRMAGLAVASSGNVVIAGEMGGSPTVHQPLGRILQKTPTAGSTEIFLVKYLPDGSW